MYDVLSLEAIGSLSAPQYRRLTTWLLINGVDIRDIVTDLTVANRSCRFNISSSEPVGDAQVAQIVPVEFFTSHTTFAEIYNER